MTKLPHDSWDVKGVEGPKYSVGPRCAVATCNRYADHAHHIWRRSFLAGDYRWVQLWDGTIVQNLCALCYLHHDEITLSRSHIVYDGEERQFIYAEEAGDAVLVPQPKPLAEFATAMQMTIDGNEVPHDHVVAPTADPMPCPTCGHRRKSRDLPAGEKRNRVSWSVSVPKDDRENGASVLDELTLACAEKLGRAEHASYKYYTLVDVLVTFAMGHIEVDNFVRGVDERDGA